MNNLEELLLTVRRPGRYVGGEWNSVKKEWSPGTLKFLLAFPDVYEVGMSHLGIKILYGILNRRRDVLCERSFAPWPDFEERLRGNCMGLFSLESRKPLKEFDIIGFSLAYELSYTNVINMLDLGGVPVRSFERREGDPIVIAGGPCCYNPEPMADFIDAFVIGDGEEVIEDIVDAYQKTRQDGRGKVLGALARIEGIYVPAFYTVEYNDDRTIKNFVPKDPDVSRTVKKRVVKDFANAHYPTDQIVPNIQTVHDRITIEIMRGCRHACAFCEACAVYAPCRERPKERVLEIARRTYAETGYDEISLLSLSSGDHSQIVDIMRQLNEEFRAKSVSVSMPSLRVEDILKNLPTLISEVKKSGLTFAPEAGSDRLRAKINKRIDLNKLYEAVLESYRAGWRRVKLYFMIGLPTEEDKDLDDIIAVVKKISSLRMEVDSAPANVAVSVNAFIPKPHTQLERSGMEENASISRKKERLRSGLKSRSIEFSSHPAVMSRLEAVFSRGDRKLGEAIYLSWRLGARFDGWQELVRKDIWDKAFLDSGIDPEFYSSRQRSVQEILPWGFIRLR